MQIDIIEQLAIVARECHAEVQRVIMYACVSALAAIGVGSALYATRKVWDKAYHDWLRLDGIGRIGAVAALVLMTMFGGAKHGPVSNAGADDGIGLVGIWTDTTNIVVSASVTNVYTLVDVKWTNGTVTTATPVSVRNSNREAWVALTKYDAEATVDLSTNVLSFTVHTNVQSYTYWWVGVDTPPIYVEEKNIVLTSFVASSTSISLAWTCEDPLATLFNVQTREKDTDPWTTVCQVPRGDTMSCSINGFWIGKTRQWRIMSSYER